MAKRPANTGEKMVNVPRNVQDEFYRYKMPSLRVKVEGKGNGIKTVIENMADIAKAIERRPDYPTKYFGLELGALTKSTDKYIVNGRHDPEDLAKLLDVFIEKYVLCGKCHNPETNMIIRGDNIGLVCRACGTTTPVDPIHRLSTYILKYPPTTDRKKPTGKAGKKQEKTDRKAKAEAQEQVVDDNNDEDWSVDTSKEAVEARRRETLGNNERLSDANNVEEDKEKEKEEAAAAAGAGTAPTEAAPQATSTTFKLEVKPNQNPVPVLQEYWKRDPPLEQVLSQIKQLQGSNNWSEATLIKSIFGSLFDENIKKNFYKKAEILRLFVPTIKEQRIVLLCIEKLCEMYPSIHDNLASIMNGFYEEEILDEEILDKWYRNPNPKFDPNLSNKIREKTKVFIDWLKNAETEDSDEI